MAIKSKFANKFYIKQYIINNVSFQEWADNHMVEKLKDNAIIGYLFSTKSNKFLEPTQVLNVYLIKREYYKKSEISMIELAKDWELFLLKCKESTDYKKHAVFKNPPIEEWLDTKDNWCKKVAGEISATFSMPFQDALSDTYYAIMVCYNKGTIYMGNLNYIKKSVYNKVLMELRANKRRVNLDSGLAISLNTVIGSDSEDNEFTIMDIIPEEEKMTEDSLEYKMLLDNVTKLLSQTFSPREIEQILTKTPAQLPTNVYRRLLTWRYKHSIDEVYK